VLASADRWQYNCATVLEVFGLDGESPSCILIIGIALYSFPVNSYISLFRCHVYIAGVRVDRLNTCISYIDRAESLVLRQLMRN
jgi:hypothetical protein